MKIPCITVYDEDNYFVTIPTNKDAFNFLNRGVKWNNINNEIDVFFEKLNYHEPFLICMTPDDECILFHKNINPIDSNGEFISNTKNNLLLSPIIKILSYYCKSDIYNQESIFIKNKNELNHLNLDDKPVEPEWLLNRKYDDIKGFIDKNLNDLITIGKTDNYLALIPKTEDAFNILCQGTKWKELNNNYIKDFFIKCTNVSPIIVLLNDKGEQFLFHQYIRPIDKDNNLIEINNNYNNDKLLNHIAKVANSQLIQGDIKENKTEKIIPVNMSYKQIKLINDSEEKLKPAFQLKWLLNLQKIDIYQAKKQIEITI